MADFVKRIKLLWQNAPSQAAGEQPQENTATEETGHRRNRPQKKDRRNTEV
jgi:hypothetical protein